MFLEQPRDIGDELIAPGLPPAPQHDKCGLE